MGRSWIQGFVCEGLLCQPNRGVSISTGGLLSLEVSGSTTTVTFGLRRYTPCTLAGHKDTVVAVAFTAQGSIYTVSRDGALFQVCTSTLPARGCRVEMSSIGFLDAFFSMVMTGLHVTFACHAVAEPNCRWRDWGGWRLWVGEERRWHLEVR